MVPQPSSTRTPGFAVSLAYLDNQKFFKLCWEEIEKTSVLIYLQFEFIQVIGTDLIHSQIYPSIRDYAQNIGNVSFVKCLDSFPLQDFLGTVKHPWVLSRLSQRQTSFHHLKRRDPDDQSAKQLSFFLFWKINSKFDTKLLKLFKIF